MQVLSKFTCQSDERERKVKELNKKESKLDWTGVQQEGDADIDDYFAVYKKLELTPKDKGLHNVVQDAINDARIYSWNDGDYASFKETLLQRLNVLIVSNYIRTQSGGIAFPVGIDKLIFKYSRSQKVTFEYSDKYWLIPFIIWFDFIYFNF